MCIGSGSPFRPKLLERTSALRGKHQIGRAPFHAAATLCERSPRRRGTKLSPDRATLWSHLGECRRPSAHQQRINAAMTQSRSHWPTVSEHPAALAEPARHVVVRRTRKIRGDTSPLGFAGEGSSRQKGENETRARAERCVVRLAVRVSAPVGSGDRRQTIPIQLPPRLLRLLHQCPHTPRRFARHRALYCSG